MVLRRALGPRLIVAAGASTLAAVPVTLLAYAGTHGWPPLRRVDNSAAVRLHMWAATRPVVLSFLRGVSAVFEPTVLRVATGVVVVLLLVRRQRRLAAWVATTMVVAGLLGFMLKDLVARTRPQLPDPVAAAPGFSFPSGHALNSMALYLVLVLLVAPLLSVRGRVGTWLIGGAIVGLVGFSRVALGLHYVSDVVAGWVVAAGLVGVTAAAFESWRRTRGEEPGRVLAEGIDPDSSRKAASLDPHPRDSHDSRV